MRPILPCLVTIAVLSLMAPLATERVINKVGASLEAQIGATSDAAERDKTKEFLLPGVRIISGIFALVLSLVATIFGYVAGRRFGILAWAVFFAFGAVLIALAWGTPFYFIAFFGQAMTADMGPPMPAPIIFWYITSPLLAPAIGAAAFLAVVWWVCFRDPETAA